MTSVLRPDPDASLPAWPADPHWDSQLGPARGICFSLLFAALLWSVVAVAALTFLG